MMKKTVILTGLVLLFSCSQRDEQFCECLEIGNQLNEFSSTILTDGASLESAEKLNEIKAKKQKACEGFLTMDGPEMIRKKAACLTQ
jgi:hypothetical protein